MNTFIKYWSYLVENEDKEISFETFLQKESNLFEASMKWPDAYLKKAKDRILNSPLGKSSWYEEDSIDKDLIDNFYNEFDTLAKKGDFTKGFFLSIIKWFIEYSGSDFNKYQEFINKKLDKIIGILTYIVSQKDDEVSQFHEINKKDKDENGNPRVYRFKKLKDMDWNTFDKEIFQKYSDQISKSVELDKDSLKSSDYEIVPIYSYEELNKKFGGDKTGYKGQSEWCHTNGKSTYDSWTDGGKYMFIVFAKKGWENITPPDPKTTNAYDDYGTSLIACLFDTGSKELLNSTLRWNHVIDPARTKLGASVDHAFKNNNDLMNTIGINISTDLDEYFKKFREINKITFVTIDGKDFGVKHGDIDCSGNNLTSLEGAPEYVEGDFDCRYNELTSLKGAPQKVGKGFHCSNNQLTSLEGAPQKVGKGFHCSNNQLTSLEGAPEYVEGDFDCRYNELTSLEGAPQEVGKGFHCSNNQLTSLEGAPQKVGGSFWCSYNKLTSLEGAPKKVGVDFVCYKNKLILLEGCPQEVSGNFACYENQLTSLKGAPKKVGGDFICDNNKLTSLEGAPQKVGKGFYCSDNELTSLEGSPQKVDGKFDCSYNQLTSLVGSPEEVGGKFDCAYNKLTSLKGSPKEVVGDFYCSGNADLPEYKIKAYNAYLKLSDAEKAPLTKDNHYYPTEEWEYKFK